MSTLQLSVYAMAMGVCVFTGALAWRTLFAHRALFAFLPLLVLMLAFDWLMHHPQTPLKNLWLLCLMAATLLVAPCVLWLAQSTGLAQRGFSWRCQFGLVLFGWMFLLPLGTAVHWGTGFVNVTEPLSPGYVRFIHVAMLITVVLFIVQTVICVRACWQALRERYQQNRALFSELDDPGLNTLRLLLLIVVANAGVAMSRVLYCALLDGVYISLSLAILFAQLGMVVFLALSFLKQQVNALTQLGELRQDHLFTLAPEAEGVVIETSPASKYGKSGLAAERNGAIFSAIQQAMNADALFTQPGLSLRDLCSHIDEAPHDVSQVINTNGFENFYDLVNQHRVAMAADLLQTHSNMTVLEIAYECGFNAKSSFNAAFKRYQGITPSQYRRQTRAPEVQI